MFFGYCRVSTSEQAQADRTSLPEQERVIRGLALTRGVSSFDLVFFSDPGVSGSTPLKHRPGGGKLMQQVKTGDVVCAAKLDRMFRDALDAQETYRDFKTHGIDLILYDLGPDPVTKSGGLSKVFFQIVSVFADAERERIRERMIDGKRAKKEKDGHTGGVAPYGFKIVGIGREAKLEIAPDEQETVEVVRQLWREHSPAQICRALAEQGRATRTGQPWQTVQVQRIGLRA